MNFTTAPTAPACPVDVAGLVALIEATDDRTVVVPNPPLKVRRPWRGVVWQAINLGGLPDGMRLRYTGRDHGDFVVRLIPDTAENTPVVKPTPPPVPVPKRMPNRLHPAVAATRDVATPDRDGWVNTRRKPGVVHVAVSKALLPRVWRVLHALFKEAERRGYEVGVGGDPNGHSCGIGLIINGTAVEVSMSELHERVCHVLTASEQRVINLYGHTSHRANDMVPTGRLKVSAWHCLPTTLASDGERWRIEDRVGAVLERLEALAVRRAGEDRHRERLRAEQAAREETQRERAFAREVDKLRVDELVGRVRRHDEAVRIRGYLTAAQTARHDLTPDEGDWLKWAEGYADRVDSTDEPLEHPVTPTYVAAQFSAPTRHNR